MLKPDSVIFAEPVSDQPMQKPTNLRIPSQSDRIRQYVRLEQMLAQQSRDVETFEEADDFDLDDDEEWVSPYEDIFEPMDDPVAPPAASDSAATTSPPNPVPPPEATSDPKPASV